MTEASGGYCSVRNKDAIEVRSVGNPELDASSLGVGRYVDGMKEG
jgi:hypothetical protein